MLLLPLGILGVYAHYQKGNVDFKVVGIMAITFIVGAWLGTKISLSISQALLKKIFALVLILVAGKMLFLDKQ
ncbi:MAG TPA: hypothetical protein DCQ29_14240 [Chitinophagaceae bacterium]|nr:hypothetical protein [Chitinophagaceae bacterium]